MGEARLHRQGQIPRDVRALGRRPGGFWGEQAKRIDWIKPFTKVKNTSFDAPTSRSNGSRTAPSTSPPTASTGTSRRAATRSRSSGKATTRTTQPDDHLPRAAREVCRFANVLKALGVKQGRPRHHLHADDPRERRSRCSPARASAPSTRSSSAASRRIRSPAASTTADSQLVITADEGLRGGKIVPLKHNVDEALANAARRRAGDRRPAHRRRRSPCIGGRDVWWHEARRGRRRRLPGRAEMDAEDPLFILYTSGSTGKPKGVLHTTGGYLVYAVDDPPATSSTTTTATSTGAPPTSAGSPATATSSTARSPTAPPR